MLHCDLRVRWKVASDLGFQAAISEPKTPSFCRIHGDLPPSTRKSLAIAIVRCWRAAREKSTKIKFFFRRAPDTFKFLRHVMRAIWSVRPKCSHRCVSLKETSLKPVQSLKHTTKNSAEQTVMRTKWFKHIAI